MKRFYSHPIHRPGGFTLIEVLVSVLILAIGLLGLAGLQLAGLQNNQSALLRSQATMIAYDIGDKLRATPEGDLATLVSDWNDDMTSQLPEGEGDVVRNGTVYTITVNWRDDRSGGLQEFQMSLIP